MKFAFFVIVLINALSSCQKPQLAEAPASPISGTWRMILATDHPSGVSITKPADIPGDVVITFIPAGADSGTFSGRTPTNQISASNYSTGADYSLAVPEVFMTKAQETSWGAEFVNHIRSAQRYGFDKTGRLMIVTAENTLTFIKL